jgi:hypothetical protein
MPSTSDWPTNAIPRRWIEALWAEMATAYGSKLADLWAGQDIETVQRDWAIKMAKLTPEQIRRGRNALTSQAWPPTLPMFLLLCQPPVEPVKAYYEAIAGLQARSLGEMGHWSHPAIFWAAARMQHDLRSCAYSQIRERWEVALKDELSKNGWPDITAPALALAAPGTNHETSKERGRELLSAVRNIVNKSQNDTNPKQWAHNIIEKSKQPNHGLTQAVIDIAQEALKNKS